HELHAPLRRPRVLADRAQLLRVHLRLRGHPPRHRPAPGLRPQPDLQGQAPGPGADPHSLRHPHRALLAGLEVDVRLPVQRDQLDAHAGAPDRVSVAVAGGAGAGHVVGHHPERLAWVPLLRSHPLGRSHRGAPGDHRGGQDRRSRAAASLPLRGGAHHPPHPLRGPALFDRLLLHGFFGGVAPDAGRALQHQPRLRDLRVQHRHQRGRHRHGGGHPPVHLPLPRRHRHPDAPRAPEGMTAMGSQTWRRIRRDYGPYLPLSPYLFVVLFPFYWMVITAFKRDRDLYNLETAPFWFKEPPTLDHIKLLWYGTLFPTWLRNSLMIGVLVLVITLLLPRPAAYALARMRFPGAPPLSTAMFLSYLIPSTLLFIPLSQVVRGLGFIDSVWALVIVYPSFTLPFCTWLLMGFVRTV